MPTASCLCGKCKASWNGKAYTKALCYCSDCKKVSGSTFSTNSFVASDSLQLDTGTPKQYTKSTDAGNEITSYFCGDCGSTLWRETNGRPGMKVLKEGTLDISTETRPTLELYTARRPGWQPGLAGAEQRKAG